MNKLRLILADRIESNAGYSSGYHDRFAIKFNVALNHVDLDKDHIYELACKEHGYIPPITGLEWDENQQWQWAQEDMCRSLCDGDDDGYKTYSPATAIKYGLPMHRFPRKYKRRSTEQAYYPARKGGWVLDEPFECLQFDVKFGLYGRGGKHLCVEEFEGHSLKLRSEDLAEQIRDHDSWRTPYSNKWCVHLLAMMDEWEKCFTSKIASAELEYQVAYRMHAEQTERAEAWHKVLTNARHRHTAEKELTQVHYNWVNLSLPGFEPPNHRV